jgi:cadmium resistance protein CadD (predicted permease)
MERNVGAAGTLQDLNVAISRSKEKLIILGNFDMMLNGWTAASPLIASRIRHIGNIILPFVLIGLGIYILAESFLLT